MDCIISDYLSQLRFGELQQYGEMAVVPLMVSVPAGPDYLTLEAALQAQVLSVTEVSQGGSVPELRVVNAAETPVLLLDGEELVGAKQNRILNTTILIKEHSDTVIPVSCTEQGRWGYVSAAFADSGVVTSPRIRARKSSSVSASLEHLGRYSSDQGAVWDEIRRFSSDSGVSSSTGAMRDVFESKRDDIDQYVRAFRLVPGQLGVFVFVSGKAVGFDVVSRETAYAALHTKLIKGYALEALLEGQKASGEPTPDLAKSFLEEAALTEGKKYESTGHGWDYRFKGKGLVGSALVYREDVIHTAFFRIPVDNETGRGSGYGRRSGFRM